MSDEVEMKVGELVRDLLCRRHVTAILGETTTARSLEVAPLCQAAHVPQITPSSTNPKVTETGDYIFRVCFLDSFQGKSLANFAMFTLGAKRAAVITDATSDYSKGLAGFFKESFVNAGGEIVAELDYKSGDKDFKEQLADIVEARPNCIFVPGYYTEAAAICQQAKELKVQLPIFGGDGSDSEKLVKLGGDAVEGRYFSTHYSPTVSGGRAAKFLRNYQKRYSEKVPDALAALGYDSALILFEALKRAGTTGSGKVRDQLASISEFEGATGKITINKNRDVDKPLVIVQVRQGKIFYVDTIKPESGAN